MQMSWGFIKILENEIDELTKEVEKLKKENQALRTKVVSLETEMGEQDTVYVSTQGDESHVQFDSQRDGRKTQGRP